MSQLIKNRCFRTLAIALSFALGIFAPPAGAELARQGPVNPANGYPQWYQDATGLALDLCLPDQIDLEAGNCLLLPADVPGGSAPETFPSNFADEHFWFAADAGFPTNGGKAILVLAVEAAFNAAVKAGDQIAFGRIRVKITGLPSSGTYKIIHPYGELEFPDQVAGDTIFYTDDVGINCPPGDFSCALKSGVGPFLRASVVPGGPASPFVPINGKTMITDPLTPTFVTGGPFSNKFRVEGPDIGGPGVNFIETELFTIMGRVHTDPIPSPLRGERASYTRDSNGGWIDVFASASAGIGKPAPNLALSGKGIVPKVMAPDGKGTFWAQTNVSSAAVPSVVQVTNGADIPPTTIDVVVTDVVTITEATYDPKAKQMTVKAKSSDDSADPPRLYLPDYNGHSCDNVLGAVISDISVPPKDITVRSSAGGSATVALVTRQADPIQLNLADQSIGGDEDQIMVFSLAPPAGGFQQGTFRILSQPAHGMVTVDAMGNASYMPASNYEGMDSFTYVVANHDGSDSNVATVNITVYPVNDPPVANPDSAATTQTKPVSINLLANDTDPDQATGIDVSTVTLVTPPTQGSVSISNGVATYTPGATAAGIGTFSFTYQVSDRVGVLSNPATVTVTVQGAEVISVATAEYRADKKRWKVDGTSTVNAGQTVTIKLRNSTTGAVGPTIGTAVVGLNAWALDIVGSTVSPAGYNQVIATSPLGGSGVLGLRAR